MRKDYGDLSFKDLPTFNKAMPRKQAWRIIQTLSTLWSKVIKGIYFPPLGGGKGVVLGRKQSPSPILEIAKSTHGERGNCARRQMVSGWWNKNQD